MSHKAGHIIVRNLKSISTVTPEQHAQLDDIESRDQYTLQDKMYLSVLTFQLADDLVD